MLLGRVIGTVVASKKVPSYNSVKLNVIQPLDENEKPYGQPIIAADAIKQAGRGELVFYVRSRDATEAFDSSFIPVDASIVAIVDEINKD
ncbi:MAG: EutN/CcmL family microcompartment protein [Spirochaetes bacterium]|nr:EutN/CcmL family microcompartment protein [Spirochaetota bacterium]